MKTYFIAVAVGLTASLVSAQGPPASGDPYASGTKFLDHDSLIKSFPGQSFLRYNIPFVDLPDKQIQDVFHYRYSALARHLHYAVQGVGHTVTEFIQPVGWAGAFSTLDAAAGHHINEIRWLRDKSYLQDYIDVWTKGPADTMSYTNWIQQAALASANVTGDSDFSATQLEGFIRTFHKWDTVYNSSVGLYYYNTLLDAQEFSLPGYISNEAAKNSTPDILFPGPNTYRPSLNSYMFAAANAISTLATTVGNTSVAAEYSKIAANLGKSIFSALWNSDLQFFVDNIVEGNPGAGKLDGREEVGFYPFRFGIGLDKKYTKPAINALFDTKGFKSEHFPTTLEMRHRFFTAQKPGDTCCFWQGQNWPFSTSHTLYALATIRRLGGATTDQYFELLSNYAATQYKDGIPYIAEEHYPFGPDWSSDGGNYSEHYAHSTFTDNVITDLLGVIPRSDNTFQLDPILPSNWSYFALENLAYHGSLVTVLYDKDGSRYKAGRGLSIYANGKKVFSGSSPKASFTLPAPSSSVPNPASLMANIAANPAVADGIGAWPRVSATYSNEDNGPEKAIDGLLFYDDLPTNRWTNVVSGGSARPNDTLTIQLQRPRALTSVTLAIYSSSSTGVGCPSKIVITDRQGQTIAEDDNFAAHCIPNDGNVITLKQGVTTDMININFFGQKGLAVGVAEVQIWVPVNSGPLYYAADALPVIATGAGYDGKPAQVAFDSNSKATANGAVMRLSSSGSAASFSGIFSSTTSTKDATVTYRNSAATGQKLTIYVNQVQVGTANLAPTGKSYKSVTLTGLPLLKGKNFVTLSSSSTSVYLETLRV